jgi:hypothetical protein
MSLNEVVIEGTIAADGTLELSQKPNLAPGRVTVVLKRMMESTAPAESWWQFMQRSRRELESASSPFMNDEEMNAHIEWLREDDRIDEMLRLESTGKPHEDKS